MKKIYWLFAIFIFAQVKGQTQIIEINGDQEGRTFEGIGGLAGGGGVSRLLIDYSDPSRNEMLFSYKKILASGSVSFKADSWHNLKLQMNGSSIKAFIDGNEVSSVTDKTNSSGPCGFGTGWNHGRFDNIKVKPLHPKF